MAQTIVAITIPITSHRLKKPARAKISKLKNVKGRKVKVSIKKIRKVKGYQIKYSDNKKFNGYWQKNSKKKTYTVKKLDKKTKYYFKVRAYVINGTRSYMVLTAK